MRQPIRGFHQDADGAWVAELDCGHPQHVRHMPPWQNRPWVMDPQGREAHLGAELECPYCEMAKLPATVARYKQTASFTEKTVPTGLLRDHRTKRGVWAEIIVEDGKLEYSCERGRFVLRPGITGIVEPEQLHCVRPLGPVCFHVWFSTDPGR